MKSIPCFYHPTTALLVDDDADFLNSLSLALAPYCKTLQFTFPNEAETYIQENHETYADRHHKFMALNQESLSELQIQISISQIHQMLNDPKRFEQIAVVVIDYDMPMMNGLELARRLKAITPIKVIILTGAADQSIAVNAFNHHEIDGFILKSDPDYLDQLLALFLQLQEDYFIDTSRGIAESLYHVNHASLKDKDFIHLFHNLSAEKNIVEYYLVEESRSFLMVDKSGQMSWLIVRSDEDMQTFYELAEMEADATLTEALKRREKIACFSKLGNHVEPVQDWHIHHATQLGNQKVYYCVLSKDEGYALDLKNTMSYQEFLRSA